MLLLKNAEILQASGMVIKGSIAIEDGIITQVGDVKIDKCREVIDCSGKLVMPGLINSHCHAPMSLLRSIGDDLPLLRWLNERILPAEDKFDARAVYWGTMLGIAEMLRNGITTFADMYFHLPQMAAAVGESGIRAVLSRGIVAVGDDPERAFNGRLEESVDFYKEYQGSFSGRLTVMLAPHAIYSCPPVYMSRIAESARRLGARVHMHISESAHEVSGSLAAHGKTPVAAARDSGLFECGLLAAHCVHVDEQDIAMLAYGNVAVAHNPRSNMFLGNGIAPVKEMREQGVIVALGTDGAACNNKLDILSEMNMAALLQKGKCNDPQALGAVDVIRMATLDGAAALGLDKCGNILPGNRADVIILSKESPHWLPSRNNASQLVYAAAASDVHTVIVDGRVVVRNRELLTIDIERIAFEVQNLPI